MKRKVTTTNAMTLGQFLRKKRIDAGYVQTDAAKILGLAGAQYVSNIERGISPPSFPSTIKLAKLYGITKQEIYNVMVNQYAAETEAKIDAFKA